MKTPSLGFLLALALSSPFAARATPWQLPGGVTLALSTSGYAFGDLRDGPAPPTPLHALPLPGSVVPIFAASVCLVNHTASDIEFTFPSQESAHDHFTYRILDNDQKLVWQSDAATPAGATLTTPPGVFHDTLRARSVWQKTSLIPLAPNGARLAPGTYTLEADVNGTPVFGATASFVVNPPKPVITTGIRGVVLEGPITPVQRPGQPSERLVPKAVVQYYNALMANAVVQSVTADEHGRFEIALPAGTYIVSTVIPGDEQSSFGHGSQTVEVVDAKLTEVTFHLDTGIR